MIDLEWNGQQIIQYYKKEIDDIKMDKQLFKNSIQIRISPEGDIINGLDMQDLPNNIGISYNNVLGFIKLFESEDGQTLIRNAKLEKLTLHILPTDSVRITTEELEFLIKNKETLKNPNICFYQSWYDSTINFNLYFGTTIHSALDYFISSCKIESFPNDVKQKHFLTLNNQFRPDRADLYEFYENLNIDDKNKFLCSFNFNKIMLEQLFDASQPINNYIYANYDSFKENIINYYKNCLFEIVSESSAISISEKSYKPILAGTPFLYWTFANGQSYLTQLTFFEKLGIDVNYFNIDYSDRFAVKEKVKELLALSTEELLLKYNDAFIKANKNKKILIDYITSIEEKIITERRVF